MIFSEDAILLSLLERYEDEQEIKDAVLSYCNRGAVSSSQQKRGEPIKPQPVQEPTPVQAADMTSEIDQVKN